MKFTRPWVHFAIWAFVVVAASLRIHVGPLVDVLSELGERFLGFRVNRRDARKQRRVNDAIDRKSARARSARTT